MKLILLRDVIRGVPDRWDHQYARWDDDSDKKKIGRNLRALDLETATRDDIAKVIGNSSWTTIKCDDCGTPDLDVAVEVGQEPDYESSTATLCKRCLGKAYRMVRYPK